MADITNLVIPAYSIVYVLVPFLSAVGVLVHKYSDSSKAIEVLKAEIESLKDKLDTVEAKIDQMLMAVYKKNLKADLD